MDSSIQYDGEYALVIFSHPHHEDLVDVHDDGLPFYQGSPIVEIEPALEKSFNFHRSIAKHFLAAQIEFGKAYFDATNYANTPDIGRDTFYFARRFARAQGRAFLKNSSEAIRQLGIMFNILCMMATVHEAQKPIVEIFNLYNVIAGFCFVGSFLADDIVAARVLFFVGFAHIVVTYIPLMVHLILGYAIDKGQDTLVKVRDAAWDGDLAEHHIDSLDGWVFWFVGFVCPEDITPEDVTPSG
ncbi:hypothetical protein CEP54_000952 [Fusarium duplospermum]|uniref:Uncharacterized protein n=1 Tax=Fusarium duplospermum TaxID=1325734 RepID=A0A428R442_9HYPO|nr:hypothetical protein CEP54_000952 [Fusarium duplospermum]